MAAKIRTLAAASALVVLALAAPRAQDGFTSLFNGKDLTGWKVFTANPKQNKSKWTVTKEGWLNVKNGPGDLQSEKTYDDFVLQLECISNGKHLNSGLFRLEWRIKSTPYINPGVPIILSNGSHKKDADGKEIRLSVPDSDSGLYMRGSSKAQVNIWCWPVGSGEVYGYRTDNKMTPEVRAGVTPKRNADRDIGAWNTFEITMRGDRLTVVLNGEEVISRAQLPGIPARGPIALQHHGARKNGVWTSPPSLVQFRNIAIKELK
jgi:hypothetical protein